MNELLRQSGARHSGGPRRARSEAERACFECAYPATASFVKEAREAASDAVGRLGLDEALLHDVRLCVSEAMTNAVRHAYGSCHGTVEISVSRTGEGAVVRVRDFGSGVVAAGRGGCGGFGLAIIATLTDQYGLTSVSGVGTEVAMAFGTKLAAAPR